MRRLPLRWLFLVPIAVILSVGAIALGIYLERSVRSDLVTRVDEELERAFAAARAASGRPEAAGEAPGVGRPLGAARSGIEAPLEFIVVDGVVEPMRAQDDEAFDTAMITDLARGQRLATIDSTPRFRVIAEPNRSGDLVVVALSLEQIDQSVASLRRNLLVGGAALFAVQVTAVWFLAGAVARPVGRMSQVAHDIATGNLDATVGAAQGSRETGDLATDLGRMLERLRATIAEQQLSEAEAIRARDEMERFMADASHELRTPLTALKGYSDLYSGGMLDEAGLDRAMDRIGSESERLTALVVGLLDLMRKSQTHTVGDVDLATVVDRVAADVSAAHPDRAISRVGSGGPLVVRGDTNSLHQAILNLAGNACHHTTSDSAIELQVESDADHAHVSIIDYGEGVDLQVADGLFAPFARGDTSRSRKSHDGAGLGLAIVQRVAELHGGSAWVSATPGGGATFGISLPR